MSGHLRIVEATAPRVVVGDAGFLPTTRRIATALAAELAAYVTPLATGDAPLARLPVLRREMRRRVLPGDIAVRCVRAGTREELRRIVAGRARRRDKEYRWIWERNEAVDRALATLVHAGDVVVGQYGACLQAFRRAKALGARTVLDYPIAREGYVRQVLGEEARRRPEFAETLTGDGNVTRDEHRRRIDEEVRLADAIIVGSSFARDSFAEATDLSRVYVVPYGVDAGTFSPAHGQPASAPLRVLFAGQVTQRKGIGYLFDAMRLLDPQRFHLTVVGSLSGSRDAVAWYDDLYGRIVRAAPGDMPAIYRSHDVLVLPSIVEGSALVVLEAMASGLPVVVTPNAGAEAVRDGVDGFIVPVRDPEAIARCLKVLESDTTLRREMGLSARERALEFSWAAFAERVRHVALGGAAASWAIQEVSA